MKQPSARDRRQLTHIGIRLQPRTQTLKSQLVKMKPAVVRYHLIESLFCNYIVGIENRSGNSKSSTVVIYGTQ